MISKTILVFIVNLVVQVCTKVCINEKCWYLNVNSKNFLNFTNSYVYTFSGYVGSNSSKNEFNTCDAGFTQGKYTEKILTASQENRKEHNYPPTLVHLTDRLISSLPPFDLSCTSGVSPKCKTRSEQYMEGLKQLKIWALQMYDANAKIPSGILSGNINQFGDFDECLTAKSEDLLIKGQYCLAYVQVEPHQDRTVNSIYNLIYSHSPFKSKLNDPGHRVPRYSSINWALCVPDACSAQDVELGLKKSLEKVFNGTDFEVQLKVDPEMCQTQKSNKMPFSTILAMWFFTLIIFISLASTGYDFYFSGTKSDLLMVFSLKKNWATLTSPKRSSNDIQSIHGVRFVNGFILLFAHKSMALFFVPYMNRTEMSEIIGQPWTVLGRAASLYTDPFIMIAGTLSAYSFYAKLQQTNKINILREYISRMFRIIPSLAALILFCTYVFPWLNTGPQWNLVVTHHSDICKKYWWRNLLFIHNYFGFKDMCLTHTHHVGIDTQLFLLSPFLVLLIWKWPKRGVILLTIWAIISTIMRYYVTYTKKLSNYIHYGTSIEQLFSTADNMYILPSHRITVYVMGIFLGYSLQYYKNFQLSSFQLFLGNTMAVICFFVSLIGPAFMGDMNYIYKPVDAAWYAAFVPILWCLSFAWIIFTSHNGYTSCIGRLFSWKGFLIWTRISYAVYLTQFPTFFYNVGIARTPDYYGFFTKNFNMSECIWILFLSVLLTLLFELPFQNIRTIMLKNKVRLTKIEVNSKIK